MAETKEKEIGIVFDFFSKISVAATKLKKGLKKGDTIHIKGATTDFTQKVESMQSNKKNLEKASVGDEIGIKVKERVRKNDKIYLVENKKS